MGFKSVTCCATCSTSLVRSSHQHGSSLDRLLTACLIVPDQQLSRRSCLDSGRSTDSCWTRSQPSEVALRRTGKGGSWEGQFGSGQSDVVG